MPNIETILREHTTLQLECIDRLYLNGYQPTLQTEGGLLRFLLVHRKQVVASPALLGQMTQRFVRAVETFARDHRIPVVQFERGQRKEDVARQRFAHFHGEEGVVFIGVAQEKVGAFRSFKEHRPGRARAFFRFYRGPVFVKQFYVYLLDRDFGPAFIKFSTYFPFTVRVWVNGHEWAKRQLAHKGIVFEALDNGFLSVADSERAQAICDHLDADRIDAFFRKWLARLPHPFSREDRAAGFRYRLSILQMEISRTEVFDRPLAGRQFFEEVIRDNLDLGRPDRVQLIFDRRVTRRTPGTFRTRVLSVGVEPTLRVEYRRSSIKQYFKEGRALRTETTIKRGCAARRQSTVDSRDQLATIARLSTVDCRRGPQARLSADAFQRVVLPSVTDDGTRVPGLRFGEPRVMALLAALCLHLHLPNGFSNRMLRGRVAALQGLVPADSYTRAKMTYDLRRLRLHGLLQRVPHSHRYVVTPAGRRVALFFSKSYARVLRRGLARLDAPPPHDGGDRLARAWHALDHELDRVVAEARLVA